MSKTPKNNSSNGKRANASDQNQRSRLDRKPNKRFNKKKLVLLIGIPILLLLTTGISYAVHLYSTAQEKAEDSYENIEREDGVSDLREQAVDPVEDNVSVLILGVDEGDERSEDGYFRTDAMMLATFNKDEGDVKLLTIPRDSYTYVPEVDRHTKINHAHSYGGVTAAAETVENFLHVPVDYYARVNFNAFIDTVDALNGIYYDVPYDLTEMDEHDNEGAIELDEGYQKLDGSEALALARTRKYDNDIERGKRQREILKTIADDVASASSILKLDDVMDAVGDNLTTNLTFDHIKSFMSYGINNNFSIDSVEMDGNGGYLNDGLWYYLVNSQERMKVSNQLRDQLDMNDIDLNAFQDGTDDAIPPRFKKDYAEQEPEPDVQQEEPDPYQNQSPDEPEQYQQQEHQQPSEPEQPDRPSDPSDSQNSQTQEQETPDSPSETRQAEPEQNSDNHDNQETDNESEKNSNDQSKNFESQTPNQQNKNPKSGESDDNIDKNDEENQEKAP